MAATASTTIAALPGDLVFGLDDEPGLRRLAGRRPRYLDERTGQPVRDADVLARIRALAVPPAWTSVWIAGDPQAHVQATGRDARGRKQYRYHPQFRAHQEAAKFDQLFPFGQALAGLRRQMDRDLRRPGLPAPKVAALVVSLLEQTFLRVGNEEYARANGSYGLTTLRDRHVRIEGSTIRIRCRAKSAKLHEVAVGDRRLARLVRRCQDLPGQVLFQYVDEQGTSRPVRSSDVNDYLRVATCLDATAKTFRTWGATVLAAGELARLPSPASAREAKRAVAEVMGRVASTLNNTPPVCRRSYVHPAVVDDYLGGRLPQRWGATSARGSRLLDPQERRLVSYLAQLAGLGEPGSG